MAEDPDLIDTLEATLAADPANETLRLHLARLLLDAKRPSEALELVKVLLAFRPDDVSALTLAASAAQALGDTEKAQAWKRLAEALQQKDRLPAARSGQHGGSTTSVPVSSRSPGGSTNGPDLDAEMRDLVERAHAGRVMLRDVAGLDEVKARLEAAFLVPMRRPDLRKAYGASMRGGLLLWGPPGCGKTFIARATAGELGAHFLSVSLDDVLDMWLGNSEKRLHEVFDYARRNRPTVLFFDEVDAIGHSRHNLARSASRNVVAQLLAEMDGVDSNNDGVFVVGATNQPWDVDQALRRPGRFDRLLLVLPPDPPGRESILRYHLRDRPFSGEPLDDVVVLTEGFSGADLRLVCEEAAQRAMSDALRTGTVRPVTATDLSVCVGQLRPSTGPWFEVASNYVTYANAAGEYDDLVSHLCRRRQNPP